MQQLLDACDPAWPAPFLHSYGELLNKQFVNAIAQCKPGSEAIQFIRSLRASVACYRCHKEYMQRVLVGSSSVHLYAHVCVMENTCMHV